MIQRWQEELGLVEARYGEMEIGPNYEWFVIKRWPLPDGWNKKETQVLVVVPPGYPTAPPDNFCTDNDLRLQDGSVPGNASANHHFAGRQWLIFSFHVESSDWRPDASIVGGHNLTTFLEGVAKRLKEVS